MTMENRLKKYSLWGGFLVFLLLAGCVPRESFLYLQPGQQLQAPPAASARPQVQLDLFREEFVRESGIIGGHFAHGERQLLKTEEGEIARTLRGMIAQHLAANNIPFTYGEEWNRSPAGSGWGESPLPVKIDGRISRLWLEVKSGLTHSKYELKLEVVSRLQLEPTKKVITRTVHVDEEVIKLTSQPAEMEKLLDKSLEEAARQIALKIIGDVKASGSSYFPGGRQ
jgi:hypothetical protein